MIKQLLGWEGKVNINGTDFENIGAVPATLLLDNNSVIKLYPAKQEVKHSVAQSVDDNTEYTITVRQYMTQPSTPEFDFMDKFNKGIPMPMRTMTGVIVKETPKMVYMKLHGQAKKTIRCMRCNKELTNPVSRLYGLGIECIQKVGIPFDVTDVENIKEALVNVTWEGWIIKSAISWE